MRSRFKDNAIRRIANWWLSGSIHFDGFRADPAAYLTAVKWRLLGKRVRARGQFAPLLSRSRHAYQYWSLHREADRSARPLPDGAPPIVALIAIDDNNRHLLDQTLQSLADEAVPAFVIARGSKDDLATAAAAIDWQADPWLMPMQAGDRIAPGSCATYLHAAQTVEAKVIFADDDTYDRWGRRTAPHFKPDWNAELYRHFDYISLSCIVRLGPQDLLEPGATTCWPEALVRHAAESGRVHHVREVLHHRPNRNPAPAAPASLPIATRLPSVSVIIPTRNRVDLLRTCLAGLAATSYPDIEVIVVDNDSNDPETLDFLASQDPAKVRVLHHPGAFNYSTINNRAAHQARGELLCLLNNDIEIISPDWLQIMATQAQRADVGAVGAQLLYPDGRIQHAGVVVGVGNAAGHAHRFIAPSAEGYFRRHALPQFTSAVTGACLVVARDRFLKVGGLDERNFAVAFNDVDLCLRLNQHGWQSLYEPRAVLIHHESVSRGLDRDPIGAARFAGELAALKRQWQTDSIVDPYHHPQLSRASEQFAVAI